MLTPEKRTQIALDLKSMLADVDLSLKIIAKQQAILEADLAEREQILKNADKSSDAFAEMMKGMGL